MVIKNSIYDYSKLYQEHQTHVLINITFFHEIIKDIVILDAPVVAFSPSLGHFSGGLSWEDLLRKNFLLSPGFSSSMFPHVYSTWSASG